MATTVQRARTCQNVFSLARSSTRVESEPSNANATPMDVDGVGKGKGKGCFVCGRPDHAAKDCNFNQAKGKGQGKRQRLPRMTRTLQPSLSASVAIVARKVTSGQSGRSERQESPRRRWSTVNSNGGGSGRQRWGDRLSRNLWRVF